MCVKKTCVKFVCVYCVLKTKKLKPYVKKVCVLIVCVNLVLITKLLKIYVLKFVLKLYVSIDDDTISESGAGKVS